MEVFGGSLELARAVFLLGAVLALVYKMKFGVTPGGIIVPSLMALALYSGLVPFIIMVLLSAANWGIYKLFLARFPLSHRMESLAAMSLSIMLSLIVMALFQQYIANSHEFIVMNLVTPGLFTISARKYGVTPVTFGTLVVTFTVYIIGITLAAVLPVGTLTQSAASLAHYQHLELVNPFIVLPVSLAIAGITYWQFGLRSGGYVIGPIVAAIAVSSWVQALMLVAGIIFSYFAIQIVLKYTQVIGLRRFVLSLVAGFVVVSIMDWIAARYLVPGYLVSVTASLIAVAVVTNDLTLQSPKDSIKKGVMPSMLVSYLTRLAV
ncbi:poly-gamma-glutamate biosynthesis protein PgsC/CapC [Candidatus Saccharibacteria bacterium]|nr:poly-gamma-glutamate biosynthesis protein PgsC/CapC [Candidatus Saccharibacteria bacterium]